MPNKQQNELDMEALRKRMAAHAAKSNYLQVPCPDDLDLRGVLAGNPKKLTKELSSGKRSAPTITNT